LPVLYVLEVAAATGIDSRAWLDKKIWRWDNIDDGRVNGVIASDPECDRDVVLGMAVGYGQEAV